MLKVFTLNKTQWLVRSIEDDSNQNKQYYLIQEVVNIFNIFKSNNEECFHKIVCVSHLDMKNEINPTQPDYYVHFFLK